MTRAHSHTRTHSRSWDLTFNDKIRAIPALWIDGSRDEKNVSYICGISDERESSFTNKKIIKREKKVENYQQNMKSKENQKVIGKSANNLKKDLKRVLGIQKESGAKSNAKIDEQENQTTVHLATLRDLCTEDKQRVTNLIKELARSGTDKQEVIETLKAERISFEKEIEQMLKDQENIISEREAIQDQLAKCQNLLIHYQDLIDQKDDSKSNQTTEKEDTPETHLPQDSEDLPKDIIETELCKNFATHFDLNGKVFGSSEDQDYKKELKDFPDRDSQVRKEKHDFRNYFKFKNNFQKSRDFTEMIDGLLAEYKNSIEGENSDFSAKFTNEIDKNCYVNNSEKLSFCDNSVVTNSRGLSCQVMSNIASHAINNQCSDTELFDNNCNYPTSGNNYPEHQTSLNNSLNSVTSLIEKGKNSDIISKKHKKQIDIIESFRKLSPEKRKLCLINQREMLLNQQKRLTEQEGMLRSKREELQKQRVLRRNSMKTFAQSEQRLPYAHDRNQRLSRGQSNLISTVSPVSVNCDKVGHFNDNVFTNNLCSTLNTSHTQSGFQDMNFYENTDSNKNHSICETIDTSLDSWKTSPNTQTFDESSPGVVSTDGSESYQINSNYFPRSRQIYNCSGERNTNFTSNNEEQVLESFFIPNLEANYSTNINYDYNNYMNSFGDQKVYQNSPPVHASNNTPRDVGVAQSLGTFSLKPFENIQINNSSFNDFYNSRDIDYHQIGALNSDSDPSGYLLDIVQEVESANPKSMSANPKTTSDYNSPQDSFELSSMKSNSSYNESSCNPYFGNVISDFEESQIIDDIFFIK